MAAGDIHIIDGVRYQLVDAGPGTVLNLLHPNVSDCEFCSFGGPWPHKCKFPRTEPKPLCIGPNFLLKLEETK